MLSRKVSFWEVVLLFLSYSLDGYPKKKTISPYLNRKGGTRNMGIKKKELDSAHWASNFF
jgi:hypothetical protein